MHENKEIGAKFDEMYCIRPSISRTPKVRKADLKSGGRLILGTTSVQTCK